MEKYYLRFLLYYVIFTTSDENRVKSCLEDSSELRTKVAAHVEHYSLRMDLLMNYTHMMSPDLQELAAINFYMLSHKTLTQLMLGAEKNDSCTDIY